MADRSQKFKRKPSSKQRKSNKSKRFNIRTSWNNEQKEIKELEERYESIDLETVAKFSDFPLSNRTLQGLSHAGYMNPTDIQKQGIAAALRGCDVLGAAKTGSGKTLAFLIPVIEALWRQRWSSLDGLGALIISPTRELAYQTFEVIVKIGCKHDLSAGLVIGGKNLKEEQARINKTNIVVCTPGRLLQHMDETPNFECNSLQTLVLDEADRILDMGFATTLNAIIENLPLERQTLLFSATQTKSVKDLARLSLQDPEYIAVHENSTTSTPQRLTQSYVVCELPEKLNFLYSFIRNHLKCKILVFASSCKQVKYIYESFRRLRPGIPVMALYGKQKQLKRVGIYDEFCKRTNCVLFATDIAARGLDFPAVNWVIQLDCPEDANTYIHRAGRTARYQKDGQSLLVLLPSEEPEMLKALQEKKVPINIIKVNPKKLTNIQPKLEAFCAQDQELKHWAQKSVVSYVRSVFLQSNKKIFDAHKLPVETFAMSLGLPNAPRIRFMKKAEKKFGYQSTTSISTDESKLSKDVDIADSDTSEEDSDTEENSKEMSASFMGDDDTVDQDDNVVFIKRRNVEVEPMSPEPEKTKESSKKDKSMVSKVKHVKKLVNKKIKLNTKIIFGEDGEAIESINNNTPTQKDTTDEQPTIEPISLDQEEKGKIGGISVEEARRLLQLKDRKDRERERKRIRDEHKKKKRKGKEKNNEDMGNEVQLGHRGDDSDGNDNEALDNEPQSKKKRKRHRSVSSEDEIENNRASLMEDEELALHFLHESIL